MKLPKISRKFRLPLYIILSIILGTAAGLVFKKYIYGTADVIGTIFLNLLKLITVPLIFTSISTGVISLSNSKNLGRLGLKTVAYYLISSLVAIITGLTLTNIIKPGTGSNLSTLLKPVENLNIEAISLRDIIVRMFPPNIFESFAKGDMLPVIIFSIIIGFFISRAATRSRILLSRILESAFELMMKITEFILRLAPIGIFGIVAKIVSTTGLDIFANLGKYFLTVLTGLLIHYFVSLPLFIYILTKLNPYKHMANMAPALLTAFSTASSSATLPLTLECAEVNSGISNKISSFVFPLGATINMDGTALYECSAAIFISQVYGVDLSFGQQFIVIFTALLASIGAAGIPMAGLVMLVIVLRSVGLPTEGIGIILAVDRILDMIRTSTNVWSDSTGAIIIASTENEIDNAIFNN
ncbi:MAG: dicarboxylate/amino acid:cation symporter [Candidatus Marinimicrobia bacterium]|nr:dicarboxylate/amino acid:cation symporter [Candidatus Neomarinimicrobiota bacterium]